MQIQEGAHRVRIVWLALIFGIPSMVICHWGWDTLVRDPRNATARLLALLHAGVAIRLFAIFAIQVLPLHDAPSVVRFVVIPASCLTYAFAIHVYFRVLPEPFPRSRWQWAPYVILGSMLAIDVLSSRVPRSFFSPVREGFWVKPISPAGVHATLIILVAITTVGAAALAWGRSRTRNPNVRGRINGLFWGTAASALAYIIFGFIFPDNTARWVPPSGYVFGVLGWLIAVRITVTRYLLVPSRWHRYRLLFESNPLPIVMADAHGQIVDANTAAVKTYGPIVRIGDLFPEESRQKDWQQLREALHAQESVTNWEQRVMVQKQERWVNLNGERLPLGERNGWAFSLRDITEQHGQPAEQLGLRDALTGLSNAEAFRRALNGLAEDPPQDAAIIFVDLDNFKMVNDAWGHLVGNQLLAEAAHRLRTVFRPDDLVARFGGDEFVVLLTRVPAQPLDEILRRIIQTFATPFSSPGLPPLAIHASVGLSRFPEDGATPEMVLQRADDAMYQAKRAGKNQYRIFDATAELPANTPR